MKKLFSLMLLCATVVLSFTACSDDDEDNGVTITKEQVVGTWDVVWAEQDGESVDIPEGYVYMRLNDDGSYRTVMFADYYTGTYTINGSTVVGVTRDPITEYYKFTSLNGNTATIDYSNSTGDVYKFRANKR